MGGYVRLELSCVPGKETEWNKIRYEATLDPSHSHLSWI